jgi:hypothetical protein
LALQRAADATQNVRRAVAKARGDVAQVDKESADLRGGGEKGRRASRNLRALLQQKVGPNLEDLGGRLATLSDAAVAVCSLLGSFEELPPRWASRIKPEQWQRWTDQAQQLSHTLGRLEAAVGDGDRGTSGTNVAEATRSVDEVLEKCQATMDDWQADLDAAREGLAQVQAEVLGWWKPAVIAVTLLCGWMAAGQASLFAHALKWCRPASFGNNK